MRAARRGRHRATSRRRCASLAGVAAGRSPASCRASTSPTATGSCRHAGWSLEATDEDVAAALSGVLDDRPFPVLRPGRGGRAAARAARQRAGHPLVLPARAARARARRALRRAHRRGTARVHAALPPARPPARRRRVGAARGRAHAGAGARRGARLDVESALGGCEASSFQCPFGDDLDGAVDHFDGGLVVDRVRRPRQLGRPPLCGGHRVARQVGVVEVREDREVDDAQGPVAGVGRPGRSPHRSEGSSPCSRRSRRPRPCSAATARGRPGRTPAPSGTGRGIAAVHEQDVGLPDQGNPALRRRGWAAR